MPNSSYKRIYPFVDYIRFISMIGIIYAHTDVFPARMNLLVYLDEPVSIFTFVGLKQITHFSVICFFIVSGFLMTDQLKKISKVTFLIQRLRTILIPYLISLFIFLLILFLRGNFKELTNSHSNQRFNDIIYFVFYSPFWFIPTLFINIIIILLFYKYINTVWFGMILLSITAFYTFGDSFKLKSHSTAFFGFAFYSWLGVYINENGLVDKIKKIKLSILILGLIAAFILASIQSYWLFIKGNIFFSNNLRFFNQVYSILFFCFLVKICPEKPSFGIFKPRQETFGLYLYHFFFVIFLIQPIIEWIVIKGWYPFNSFPLIMAICMLNLIVCYTFSTAFVKLLRFWKVPVL